MKISGQLLALAPGSMELHVKGAVPQVSLCRAPLVIDPDKQQFSAVLPLCIRCLARLEQCRKASA